jgi:hypothetical protein
MAHPNGSLSTSSTPYALDDLLGFAKPQEIISGIPMLLKIFIQALFPSKPPEIKAGMRVNLADPYRPQRCDGVVESLRGNDALVSWATGGSSWERSDDLYPLATD